MQMAHQIKMNNRVPHSLSSKSKEWLGGVMVRALDLQLENAGSIPAAALPNVTFGKSFTYIWLCHQAVWCGTSISWGSKQAHCATHWAHCLAASVGVWLRAEESEISATLLAKWLKKDFTTYKTNSNHIILSNSFLTDLPLWVTEWLSTG